MSTYFQSRLQSPLQSLLQSPRSSQRIDPPGEHGQASVEYALVLLGAALVATLLISWATKTNLLDALFNHVMGLIKGKAS